jgi:4-hydroxybenzoate polyprenyltransferase
MPASVELDSREIRELSLTKPLDEAVWQGWLEKGRAQERRSSAARVKAVKWVSIAGLLAAAGLWSYLPPYEVVVRFIVAASAVVVMFHAFHTKHYTFAALFFALALLYNPVVPVFSFSGDWQRALVVASSVPFVASLAWGNVRLTDND